MDDQVTDFLNQHEDQLSQEIKDDYTVYNPNDGDHQVFDTEANQDADIHHKEQARQIGAVATNVLNVNRESAPAPEPTPEPTPTPEPFPAPEPTPAPYDGQ